MRAPRCTVCTHRRYAEINAMLRAGLSRTRVATEFGLHKDAVNRHANGGHAGTPGAEHEAPALLTDEGAPPRERLLALINRLESQLSSGGAARTDLVRELRLAYADLGKMPGAAAPTEVGLRDVEGLSEFFRDCLFALEPYPEARLALVAVLERHGLS